MATLIADGTAKAISDWLTNTALSIKADGASIAAPGNGAALIAGFDSVNNLQRTVDSAAFDSGAINEARIGLLVRAAMTGSDSSLTANVRNIPIEANDASVAGRFTKTLNGALVNARLSAYRLSNADWAQLNCDTPTTVTGELHNTAVWTRANSAVYGRDTSDNTMRLIEARASILALSSGVYRLQTDSQTRVLDTISGNTLVLGGIQQDAGTALRGAALFAYQARGEAYLASREGRRYVCKSPNQTGVAAATSFVTTTPTFLAVAGATKEIVVRRITVTLQAVGTSTTFIASVKTDTANRFSSGGTARAPGTMNQGNTVATGLAQNLETPTATAESTAIDVSVQSGSVVSGAKIEFLFLDGLIVAANGSLLLYVVTATSGATVNYEIEFEEVNCQ